MESSLEQVSKMCWAVNWAARQAWVASKAPRDGAGVATTGMDVRINIVVGDAVDACDAICSLSAEGLGACGGGVARDGADDVGFVCFFRRKGCRRGAEGGGGEGARRVVAPGVCWSDAIVRECFECLRFEG